MPSDVIFVFAGKQERKAAGLDLWKRGYAPEIILSVGRFEWRRFSQLDLQSDGGLLGLVEKTRPQDRHFFVRCSFHETSCTLTRKAYFGTRNEAREFARIVGAVNQTIMVVSTSFHLRRARLVFRRAFRSRADVEIHCVAVPESEAYVRRSDLRRSWRARWAVLQEFGKYVVYWIGGL
jgi:hypothetical protein